MSQLALFEKVISHRDDSSRGNLRPITSLANGRYDKCSFATPHSVILAPGFQSPIPHYLLPQWTAHIHPEGQLYFHRHSVFQVTTDAYLYNPEILDTVVFWIKKIEALIEEKNMPLSDSIELYILIEDTGCAYYFIDHASRSLFWLEAIPSEQLNIPDVGSSSHLSLYLEYLYWTHVEHFPMHFGGIPVKLVENLLSVFSHALTDQMTSQTSTFFYTQKECAQFIKILKLARENSSDGHQVCVIARLWRQVCDNRFVTHYGQETSRLSRDQAILYDPPQPSSRVSTLARCITFTASDAYLTKLNDLFVDRLVYFSQWQPFIRRCLYGWRRSFWSALAIIILHGFVLFVECEPLLAVVSASLTFTSLLTSLILVHRYDRLESDDACAHDVHEHLTALHSSKYNFQFIALSYALPNALQLWALVFLALNALVVLRDVVGTCCAFGCGLFVAVVLFWFLRITSERSWNLIPQALRRDKSEHDMV
ncbi:hypothetical protein DFJ43DRAFT_1050094 [Lentinula guzmanii]|uniref:WW domain-containing protein n=1 Tax=Lentinula guzmanii TaxID=2804957 RepID=A0AA38N414_9AGAR|nr:hypothetical protein DFJ43DRAFT_1050094 [Lentinula guzmanii]